MERDIEKEVLDYVSRNGKVRGIHLEGVDQDTVDNVVKSLKMTGALQGGPEGIWMGKPLVR